MDRFIFASASENPHADKAFSSIVQIFLGLCLHQPAISILIDSPLNLTFDITWAFVTHIMIANSLLVRARAITVSPLETLAHS